MLKAFENQLKELAQNDSDCFHRHLRDRVGKKATSVLEDRLKEIILLMPELVGRIYFHWNRSGNESKTRFLGGYVLTYLYVPDDFLSVNEWGLFGYLDDAYLVAKIYTQVVDDILKNKGKVAGIDLKYYDQSKFLKRYVRGVIPHETQKIDEMVSQLSEGSDVNYQTIFSGV